MLLHFVPFNEDLYYWMDSTLDYRLQFMQVMYNLESFILIHKDLFSRNGDYKI